MNKECRQCKKVFEKPYYTSKKRFEVTHYCSYNCYWETLKGNTPWNKNMKGYLGGEKHYKWSGGKKGWVAKKVRLRDNETCQNCGLKDSEVMVVDHVIPKAVRLDLIFEMKNLVTLCANCHLRKTNKERRTGAYKNKQVLNYSDN